MYTFKVKLGRNLVTWRLIASSFSGWATEHTTGVERWTFHHARTWHWRVLGPFNSRYHQLFNLPLQRRYFQIYIAKNYIFCLNITEVCECIHALNISKVKKYWTYHKCYLLWFFEQWNLLSFLGEMVYYVFYWLKLWLMCKFY